MAIYSILMKALAHNGTAVYDMLPKGITCFLVELETMEELALWQIIPFDYNGLCNKVLVVTNLSSNNII